MPKFVRVNEWGVVNLEAVSRFQLNQDGGRSALSLRTTDGQSLALEGERAVAVYERLVQALAPEDLNGPAATLAAPAEPTPAPAEPPAQVEPPAPEPRPAPNGPVRRNLRVNMPQATGAGLWQVLVDKNR